MNCFCYFIPESNAKLSPNMMASARFAVERKIQNGERSVRRNKYNTLEGLKVRQYRPKPHDDDLFLPTKLMGSWQVGSEGYLAGSGPGGAISSSQRSNSVWPELILALERASALVVTRTEFCWLADCSYMKADAI